MGIFRRRRGYESRLIGRALDPYHYPVDAEGNPIPTSSVRATLNERVSQQAHVEQMPDPSRGDPGTDVPVTTGTDEHIVVDLTAEDSDVPKPTTDTPFLRN